MFSSKGKTTKSEQFALTFLQYENELTSKLKKSKEFSYYKKEQNSDEKKEVNVAYIYRPLEYAAEPHANFVRKYCKGEKAILILGMNPGPWGMSQTGVPFGEIKAVSKWMKIERGNIKKPEKQCPKRPITGFDVKRSEESGKRLFNLFQEICGEPDRPDVFFKHTCVYNFCPLQMMDGKGCNITPSRIRGETKNLMEEDCGKTLLQILRLLKTKIVIAVGRYAETQAKKLLKKNEITDIRVVYMRHPSPIGNNKWEDWKKIARTTLETTTLEDEKLIEYFKI